MEVVEMLIISVVVGLFLKAFLYDPFIIYWQDKTPFSEQAISILNSLGFKIFLICFAIIIFAILN